MREILFRGKRIENGEWVYGSLLKDGEAHRLAGRPDVPFSDYYLIPKTERNNTVNTLSGGRWMLSEIAYHVVPETVGQYTGLADKNGKKIFEGDIIKIPCYRNDYGVVGYEVPECQYRYAMQGDGDWVDFAEWGSEVEVIGNIHDNPELLGGADNGE